MRGIPGGVRSLTVLVVVRYESARYASLLDRLDRVIAGGLGQVLLVDGRPETPLDRLWSTALTAAAAFGDSSTGRGADDGAEVVPTHDWFVVMDGDLGHPPELLPYLLHAGVENDADFVEVHGTRRGAEVRSDGLVVLPDSAGPAQRLASALAPQAAGSRRDRVDGYFAVRRDCVDVDDLALRHPRRVRLDPAGARQRLRVVALPGSAVRMLDRLPDEPPDAPASPPDVAAATPLRGSSGVVRRGTGFAAVGITGLAVNNLALWCFVEGLGLGVPAGAVLATQVSTAWNFLLIDALVFRGVKQGAGWKRFLGFALVNNTVLLLRLPVLAWFVDGLGVGYLLANVITLLLAFVVRFLISDRYLFRPRSSHDPHARADAFAADGTVDEPEVPRESGEEDPAGRHRRRPARPRTAA